MANSTLHRHKSLKLKKITSQGEDYKSFYMKKKTWEAICEIRGWSGRGSVSRFAESIHITRQYASGIVSGAFGCSSNVMRKIIHLLGITGGCWCHLFDTLNIRNIDPNHPMHNYQKANGEIPYGKYSLSADLHKQDYKVEEMA